MTQQTTKGVARRLRKAMRRIGDMSFPRQGSFHLRGDDGDEVQAGEVAERYGSYQPVPFPAATYDSLVRCLTKPQPPAELGWHKANGETYPNGRCGYFSVPGRFEIEPHGSRSFRLLDHHARRELCIGTLTACKGFAQGVLRSEAN